MDKFINIDAYDNLIYLWVKARDYYKNAEDWDYKTAQNNLRAFYNYLYDLGLNNNDKYDVIEHFIKVIK